MAAGLKLALWRIRRVVVAVAVSAAMLVICAVALLATLIAAPPLHKLHKQ